MTTTKAPTVHPRDSRNIFAAVLRVCESEEANTHEGIYPMITELTRRRALVLCSSKRKAWFAIMHPEVGGEDGCEMEQVGERFWKAGTNKKWILDHVLWCVARELADPLHRIA